jgi:copper transporter 1
MQANNTAMCKSMPGMTGCSCDSCTVLQIYGELCKEMGGGEGCEGWEIFCKKIPDWTICTNLPGYIIPEMKMYFHWGWYDYILFKSWVPYSELTYGISVIAVFFIALLHEGYKVLKIKVEARWKLKSKYERIPENTSVNAKPHTLGYSIPLDWQRDIILAVYKTIDMGLHYLVMLIAMTFNGGLFIAVILGYGFGYLLFSRLSARKNESHSSVIEVEDQNCH